MANNPKYDDGQNSDLKEKLVAINRVAKVVKGVNRTIMKRGFGLSLTTPGKEGQGGVPLGAGSGSGRLSPGSAYGV